jgi:thiol-disulfide isomerase/thioredoxin
MVTQTEFSTLKSHRIRVNRKELAENAASLKMLLGYLEQNYQNSLVTIKDKRINDEEDLVQVINNKLQIDYFNKLSMLQLISNSKTIDDKRFSATFVNSELLNSSYSNFIIGAYLRKKVIKQKPDFSRSKEYIDYKEAYDSIGNYLTDDSLVKYAKFLSIEKMVEYNEPIAEVDYRYKNFNNLYHNDRLSELLSPKLSTILNDFQQKTGDLFFTDSKGKIQAIKDIIQNANGKLIYVDFWASWCIPCREAMPDAKQLRTEYEKKNVLFLYLSIDKDKEAWKTAETLEGLVELQSYLILNYEASNLLKQIKLKTIPRYILFDKKGKLVHIDAPGPKGESIRSLLDKQLKEGS